MDGKVALITGGARGLGKAFADKLLSRGAKVCIIDILQDLGNKTTRDLQTKYDENRVCFYKCDVNSKDNFEGAVNHTIKKFGRLDIMCNNAGVESEDVWQRTIYINLMAVIQGTMLGMQYMSPPSGQGGVIINVASVGGFIPLSAAPVNIACKHGVVGYTRSIGGQARRNHNVRVNCICPSFTQTDMISDGIIDNYNIRSIIQSIGVLTPDEVADAFMKLIEASDKMSGAVMMVTPQAKRIIQMPKTIDEALEAFSKL